MSIEEKIKKYTQDFSELCDPFSQGEYLIGLGIGRLDEQEIRRDQYRIVTRLQNGNMDRGSERERPDLFQGRQ